MRDKKQVVKNDTTIYLCNWDYGYINQRWTWEKFGNTVLESEYYYHYYLDKQNVTTQDTRVLYSWQGVKDVSIRPFTFLRRLKGDEYACLDIRHLKHQWQQEKHADPKKDEVVHYWERADFRNGPVSRVNNRRAKSKQAVRLYGRIKHHPYLKELALENDEYAFTYQKGQRKAKLNAQDIYVDWGYYRNKKTSRSWKDQSRKKRQWM